MNKKRTVFISSSLLFSYSHTRMTFVKVACQDINICTGGHPQLHGPLLVTGEFYVIIIHCRHSHRCVFVVDCRVQLALGVEHSISSPWDLVILTPMSS